MFGILAVFDPRVKARQIAALKSTNEQLQSLLDLYADRAFAASMQLSQQHHRNLVAREQLIEQIKTLSEELRQVKAKHEISEGRFSIADLRKVVVHSHLRIMLKTAIINLLDGEAKRQAARLSNDADGSR